MPANPYQLALEVQDACNASGVVKSLSNVVELLWIEARKEGKGTDYVNKHPVLRLFLEQLVYLNGGAYNEGDGPTYSEAYAICESKANVQPT